MKEDSLLNKSKPVYSHIGQFSFKEIIHQLFVPVSGIFFCAGPAAKIDPGSGPLYVEWTAAFITGFFYLVWHFNPLFIKSIPVLSMPPQ